MKISLKYISAILGISLLFVSCDKDDDDDKKPSTSDPTQASIGVHFNHHFGTETLELNKFYALDGNTSIKFTTAQYYFGNPVLENDAANVTTLSPQFIFVNPTVHMADLGKVNPGHLHLFKFDIGIDSTTNKTVQPIDFEEGEALGIQNPNMHWSWNSGYIFYKFEGEIDTDGDNVADTTFGYHIGLNDFLITISSTLHMDAAAGDEITFNIEMDYAKIFDGLDLSTELSTHTMNNMPLATKIKANVEHALAVETDGDVHHH